MRYLLGEPIFLLGLGVFTLRPSKRRTKWNRVNASRRTRTRCLKRSSAFWRAGFRKRRSAAGKVSIIIFFGTGSRSINCGKRCPLPHSQHPPISSPCALRPSNPPHHRIPLVNPYQDCGTRDFIVQRDFSNSVAATRRVCDGDDWRCW